MAAYSILLESVFVIVVFLVGFNLARSGLSKINIIEGKQFRARDVLASSGFGIMFMIAIVICINVTVQFLGHGAEIFPDAGYMLFLAFLTLLIYPIWEMLSLAKPTSNNMTGYHEFLQSKIVDRFHGKTAYGISILLLFLTYGVPVVVLSVVTSINWFLILFLWIIVVPLVFLNYFAASGQASNIVRTSYLFFASDKKYPGLKQLRFQTTLGKMAALLRFVIALVPLIVAGVGLVLDLSTSIQRTDIPQKTGISAYLSLFTTVVFGIQGFFTRFWNKKSKTSASDFLFGGYIMIAIMMNIILNYISIDKISVMSMFVVSIPGLGQPFQQVEPILTSYEFLLPVLILQYLITLSYSTVILFFKRSPEFIANLQLGTVIAAYEIPSNKLFAKLKKQEKQLAKEHREGSIDVASQSRILPQVPNLTIGHLNLVAMLKSIMASPSFNKYGLDINKPLREKAAQFLTLIARQSKKELVTGIIEYLRMHTVGAPRDKKHVFLSPEAFKCLGNIGKSYPQHILNPLLEGFNSTSDKLMKRYILNALSSMGGHNADVQTLAEEIMKAIMSERNFEVKDNAIISMTEIVMDSIEVHPVVQVLCKMLEEEIKNPQPQSELAIETITMALYKLSMAHPRSVPIDVFTPLLSYKPPSGDPDTEIYILLEALRAIAFLVHFQPDKVPLDILLAFAHDERAIVRLVVCEALGHIALTRNSRDILQVLVNRSLEDTNDGVRDACNDTITEICVHAESAQSRDTVTIDGKPWNILAFYLHELESPDATKSERASEALRSIAKCDSQNIRGMLEGMIEKNQDESVISNCVYVLSTLDVPASLSIRLPLLYNLLENGHDGTSAQVIRTLGFLGSLRRDIDLVRVGKFLTFEMDPELRFNAASALGKIGTIQPVAAATILIKRLDTLDLASRSRELEVIFDALGAIGKAHPYNTIVETLERALTGDANPFIKDAIAKALYNIAIGLIDKKIHEKGEVMKDVAVETAVEPTQWKMTYLPGNIAMILLNALQMKGVPDDIIDVISGCIQDLLPYFLILDSRKKGFIHLDTIKKILTQAYNTSYSRDILETIDRINSLKAFRSYVEETHQVLREEYKFFAKSYIADGKQYYDQGVLFKNLGFDEFALVSFHLALEMSPHELFSPLCHLELGKIYEKDDQKRAWKEYDLASTILAFFDDINGFKECERLKERIQGTGV